MIIIAIESFSSVGTTDGIDITTFDDDVKAIEYINEFLPDDAIDKSKTTLTEYVEELKNFDRYEYEEKHESDNNFDPSDIDLVLTINIDNDQLFCSTGYW